MHANASQAFVFIAAQLLSLPGLAIALYLVLVGRVADSGGWLRAAFELLFSGMVVLPFVLLCCLALAVAGLFATVRPWAAMALASANIAALAVAWGRVPPQDGGDLWVWLPSAASTALAAWLASRALPLAAAA